MPSLHHHSSGTCGLWASVLGYGGKPTSISRGRRHGEGNFPSCHPYLARAWSAPGETVVGTVLATSIAGTGSSFNAKDKDLQVDLPVDSQTDFPSSVLL